MKLIIAGPRDLVPKGKHIQEAINHFSLKPEFIISGGARGVDTVAIKYAKYVGIQPIQMDALWDYYKRVGHLRHAGPVRNINMSEIGDELLVIKRKDVKTSGTSHMIRSMEEIGKPVYIYEI